MATKKKTPSRAERTGEKIAFVRDKLGEMLSHDEIKDEFAKHFKCSPRSAEPWIVAASVTIQKETKQPVDERRALSYERYRRVLNLKNLTPRDMLKCLERIDKILGNEAPILTAATDTSGKDVSPNKAMSVAEARAIIESIRQRQSKDTPDAGK